MRGRALDVLAGSGALVLLLLLALVVLGLLALAVYAVVLSAGVWLRFGVAVLVIVVASAAWREVRGRDEG